MSRPDPSSPASVAEATFSTARRGFQQDEVRAFLVAVGAELGRLHERERQLEAELREARALAAAAPSRLDEATVTEMLGEETVRVLQTARESASQIKIRAEEAAARVLREASDEANRLRQETEVDVARRRQEASSDAEAEVALAKQQGREMVNEARAYRERVLADLDRRTTLARKQIEELIHGRDRLLQVFERARLVAVDVTSELRDIDTPDELVNLTPTTGPVPIMVPQERTRRTEAPDAVDAVDRGRPAEDEPIDDTTAVQPDDGDAATPAAEAASGVAADDATVEQVEPEVESTTATDAEAEADTDAEVDDEVEVEDEGAGGADDDAADGTLDDEGSADDGTLDDDDPDEPTTFVPVRDDNVVSLFRDRPVHPADDDEEHDDAPAAAGDDEHGDAFDDDASDDTSDVASDDDAAAGDGSSMPSGDEVGGLFARLRDELPATDTVVEDDDRRDADGDADGETVVVEPPDTPFTRRDEVLVPLIVSAARKLKRVLADEQNLALDALRRKEPVTSLADLVPDLDDHVATYRTAVEAELLDAAVAGAAEAGVADSRSLRTRLVRAGALDEASAWLRSGLIGPLRDRVQRSVTDGAGDNEAIAKRVRAVYREWKTQHIDSQLDDVFRFAHGGGVARAVEPGTPMVWTIDPTEPACPDCEDNSLAGAVPAGEPFPTGHAAAPAHPGCRCLALPAG